MYKNENNFHQLTYNVIMHSMI